MAHLTLLCPHTLSRETKSQVRAMLPATKKTSLKPELFEGARRDLALRPTQVSTLQYTQNDLQPPP